MPVYPGFLTPPTLTVLAYFLMSLTPWVIVLIVLIWFIRKMNNIDRTLKGIVDSLSMMKKEEEVQGKERE
ncbi:hypothetical protein [Acididesulfobacillus acetoxydans]|nr:hypothetical protein [Acididesulfobacillus acetoxydans]